MYFKVEAALGIVLGITSGVASMEPPSEKLAKAREVFNNQTEKARKMLLARYSEEHKSLVIADRPNDAINLREQMKMFETQGVLYGNPVMEKDHVDYVKEIRKARASLVGTFDEIIKELTEAQALDKADDVRNEMTALGLEGRLVSLAVFNRRVAVIQHADYLGWARKASEYEQRLNGTFEIVPGLSDRKAVSFRSVNLPNHYLVHGNHRVRAQPYDSTDQFRQNATYRQARGLAAAAGAFFESVNHPEHFLRARGNGELWLDKSNKTLEFRQDATFAITDPKVKFWWPAYSNWWNDWWRREHDPNHRRRLRKRLVSTGVAFARRVAAGPTRPGRA